MVETPRPLTHDLICDFISNMDILLKSVIISASKNGVYFSEIKFDVDNGKEERILDARPSDAIAVALRMQTPIFVAKTIFNESCIDKDIFLKENKNKHISEISISKLKEKLEIAVEKEEYEYAATLRDKINKLES